VGALTTKGHTPTRLALVATVREPAQKLVQFVNYHLNVGFDHLYLFLDDPLDQAGECVPDSRVTIVRCTNRYWQDQLERLNSGDLRSMNNRNPAFYRALTADLAQSPVPIEARQTMNAAVALREARRLGVDWILHIDGDELVHAPAMSLKRELEAVHSSISALLLGTMEAVPDGNCCENPFLETALFRDVARPRMSLPVRVYVQCARAVARAHALLGRLAGCGGAFFDGEYFRGHIFGKSLVRTSLEALELGLHLPVAREHLMMRVSRAGCLLHYDCMTFESWLEKWRRRFDGSGRATKMRKSRSRQGDLFWDLYRAGSIPALESLYQRLYFLPAHEQERLLSLGLLRRIQLPESLFSGALRPSPEG